MPPTPGMRRSRMATSNLLFSRILKASCPSAQTVTSYPRRGSSVRKNSCKCFSSSTKRTRRLCPLGGVAKALLLTRSSSLGGLQRQAHAERAALAGSRAGGLDLSSVLADDAVRDGQSQSGPLAGAVPREERLEDVL